MAVAPQPRWPCAETMDHEQIWSRAVRDARQFLGRWNDALTRRERDDLAQEAALLACCRRAPLRAPERFPALVRTISRRLRVRALERARRHGELAGAGAGVECMAPCLLPEPEPVVRVQGAPVARGFLLERLAELLPRLRPANRRIVLEFYAGRSCRQLAAQLGLSEAAVKVRLHRTRRTLERKLEAAARAAGHFEP